MRQDRRFTLINLKEYTHTANIKKGASSSWASYGGDSWTYGFRYVLNGQSNQCVGYGYEYDENENGDLVQRPDSWHSMSMFTSFKFSFNGKSTGFKFDLTDVLCPHANNSYNWAISTTSEAKDFKSASSPGTTGVIKSGTFKSGSSHSSNRKTLNVCEITLNNEIKSDTPLYFYIWPANSNHANFHIFGNIKIQLQYTNYKKSE